MENLAPHQLPTVELDVDYYKLIKYSKKAKAFHLLEDLLLEHGDYIILKPKQDSSESSCLARITEKKKIRLSGVYSVREELGFCNGHMAERDIKLTYPDIDKNTPIYLYYVKILS